MYFVFCLDETEIYASKSAYIPVEISKTPAPVETEKPKTTETVKKETKATTKNTQSKAVKQVIIQILPFILHYLL